MGQHFYLLKWASNLIRPGQGRAPLFSPQDTSRSLYTQATAAQRDLTSWLTGGFCKLQCADSVWENIAIYKCVLVWNSAQFNIFACCHLSKLMTHSYCLSADHFSNLNLSQTWSYQSGTKWDRPTSKPINLSLPPGVISIPYWEVKFPCHSPLISRYGQFVQLTLPN